MKGGEPSLQGYVEKFGGTNRGEIAGGEKEGAGKMRGNKFNPEGRCIEGPTLGAKGDTFTDSKQNTFPRTGWLAGRNMKDLVSGEKLRGQSDAAGLGEHDNVEPERK